MAARRATDTVQWQAMGVLDRDAMAKARWETINLVQWLARIANSYVTAGSADERVQLEFRPNETDFLTKTFAGNLSLELRLPNLNMQFYEGGQAVPHVFDPEERSPAEVEAWLLVELLHRGVDRTKFSKALPYDVPGLMTGDAEDHSPQSCGPALMQLALWFANAAAALAAAARAGGAQAVDIVCRPQTLDLTCVSNKATVRPDYGFVPGDAEIPEPYFYRYRPATNGSPAGTTRSVLKATELFADKDPAAAAVAFMKGATG
jgi:hypothetical protein